MDKTCALCNETKPIETFAKSSKAGKGYYLPMCKPCYNRTRKRDRLKRGITWSKENADYETVRDHVIYDYRFVRDGWGWDHETALLWLARGYRVSWTTIVTWPIEEDAGYGSQQNIYQ